MPESHDDPSQPPQPPDEYPLSPDEPPPNARICRANACDRAWRTSRSTPRKTSSALAELLGLVAVMAMLMSASQQHRTLDKDRNILQRAWPPRVPRCSGLRPW